MPPSIKSAYYNEIDPYAAQWLRNLIAAGHIAPGDVDERSIEDVHPADLRGYTQCHFFAGIGVWSLALRQAGWADDRPVWTGSCPCQPFSAAGKGAGFADERHLWPAFHHLISECRPECVLGEQVASGDAAAWIDLVHTDLEALGYAFGCAAFPSAGIGAPHIRDRAYWVADTRRTRLAQRECVAGVSGSPVAHHQGQATERRGVCAIDGLDDTRQDHDPSQDQAADHRQPQADRPANQPCRPGSALGGVGITNGHGCKSGRAAAKAMGHGGAANSAGSTCRPGPSNGLWRAADWLLCRDGKWRPVEPGTFPLAYGAPARVGRLRAYGNAINAQAAQAFIECVMEETP
jgi:DNA (cytosine-5)-methyltransferase 1